MTNHKEPPHNPSTVAIIGAGSATLPPLSATGIGHVGQPKPMILLSSLVQKLRDLPDGDLVTLVEPAWQTLLDMLERDPSCRFSIPPRKWEEIIAAAYDAAGFDEVILTPSSGDGGRDVIATRAGFAQIRIIDQVKAFGPGKVVDANDVRALLGVLHADRNATKGFVTTTAKFAPRISEDPSIAPFVPYRLELFDGDRLISRLTELRRTSR